MDSTYCQPVGVLTRSKSLSPASPIGRLPAEVLEAIFKQHIEMHWNDLEARIMVYTSAIYDWIWVSQVNRFWRGVALALSSLWSRIFLPCANTDLLRLLLLRSGSSPLHVRIWGDIVKIGRQNFDDVGKHFDRLATLEVRLRIGLFPSYVWQRFITEGLINAPLLTHCNLKILSATSTRHNPRLKLESVPECRRLQHLKIKGLPFSVVKGFCQPNLTSLSLTCGEDISVIMLLSVLSTTSLLEELSIYPPKNRAIPMMDNSRMRAQDVSLPRLSTLMLSSDVVESSILLDHLVLPSTTNYNIQLGYEPAEFMLALGRKLEGIKTIGCGQLSARFLGDYMLVWKAWATDVSFEEESLPEDTPLVCIRMLYQHTKLNPGMASIFSNLALSKLKRLQVANAWRLIPSDSWDFLFTLMPHLEDLYLIGPPPALGPVSQALRTTVTAEPTGSQTIVLPQLRALSVGFGIRLTTIKAVEQFATELGSILESRITFGSKVHRLVVGGIPGLLSIQRLKPLEKLVDRITLIALNKSDLFSWDSSSESDEPLGPDGEDLETDGELELEPGSESD